jgi:hypothetical protein
MALKLSRELKEQLALFIEQHPPREFSSSLRNLVLDYISHKVNVGFPLGFGKFVWSLSDLFDLLETAAETMANEEANEVNEKKKSV